MTAYDGETLGERMRNHFSGSTEHLYGVLVREFARDWEAGGVVREILDGYDDAPPGDMVQLRLLAGLHRIVLRGDAPELAAFYPSMGGTADRYAVWSAAQPVLAAHVAELTESLEVAPQTNEPGRSLALLAGLSEAVRRTGLSRVRLLEPGAAAGLNLLVDRYRFIGDGWSAGPTDAQLVLQGCGGRGLEPAAYDIVTRRGCDLEPVDASSMEGAAYLRSFVWPHMPERDARLAAACATEREHPVVVDRAPGASWVTAQLADSPGDDVLTVVWHSVTRQYWPVEEQDAMTAAIDEARSRMPLARVALEDARLSAGAAQALDALPEEQWQAVVEVDDEVIAHCAYHGPPLDLVT